MLHPVASRAIAFGLVAFSVSSCAALRIAREPLRVVEHAALTDEAPTRMVVLLPGYGDRPGKFERQGFIDMIHEVDPSIEVVAPDAHFGYYRKTTIVTRVFEDIVEPASARGLDVWLVGISMGGAGALSVLEAHEEALAGVILLAPYTGGNGLADEVRDAGGLVPWNNHYVEDENPRDTFFRDIWVWLDHYDETLDPPIYLGVGTDDSMDRGADLIGATLPDGQFETVPGGHDWPVWKPLFETFAERAWAEE